MNKSKIVAISFPIATATFCIGCKIIKNVEAQMIIKAIVEAATKIM